jgi:hypothetical protein
MIIFGICSAINGNNKGVYSAEERLQQTLKTIQSIRDVVEDSYIVLCDNSNIDSDYKDVLMSSVDLFINVKSNDINKSYNESFQVLKILESINIEYDYFFKISGRYYLLPNFDINQYINDKINFREFNFDGRLCYSTVLYSFNKKNEDLIISTHNKFTQEKKYSDIETGLYFLLNKYVNKLNYLGVAGNIAPSGEYLEH